MSTQSPTVHTPSPRRRWLRAGAAVGVGALALTALVAVPASANHPEVSLPGSNFEIDFNANLEADDAAPSIDWASVDEVRQPDAPTGADDDSFGQGAKEDTPVPTVVDGSIPPNKSDLLNFGLYLEDTPNGDFLHLFWHRVQEPSGTTNMDFEFNKSATISSNEVTPVRSEGDVLIQYDLSQGGINPNMFVAYWLTDSDFDNDTVNDTTKADCVASNSFPCWGKRADLTAAGDATGSINSTAIEAADSDGLGAISPRTFGEATVDFSALGGSGCTSFGSAYLKSRSSDSFSAALKDFIAPTATGLNNCGALKIVKTKKDAASDPTTQPHAGVDFTVTGPSYPNGTTVKTGTDGTYCLGSLTPGSYTVRETVPAGYAVTSPNPQTATVVTSNNDCSGISLGATKTFTNMPLTNLTVSVDSQIPGGTFSSIECDATTEDPDTEKDVDLSDKMDDPIVTIPDLQPGTYTCVVVIDP